MAKRIAVLAVNPVNGLGLFQYLESFYENQIIYRVYAVAETTDMRTNSGIRFYADDVIENLKGHAHEYDALVFSCGDAVPVFKEHASEAHNVAMMQVIKEFAEKGKLMAGHCAAALMFEIAGVTEGKRLALHPMVKSAISKGIATDAEYEIDGNFFTAQCEHTLPSMMPQLIEVLKK